MSGYNLNQMVKRRLRKRHTVINKIIIHYDNLILTDAETIELDGLLGYADSCDKAIAKVETMPLEELEKLVLIILKKRKKKGLELEVLAGVG
jgi:hypothetical protein